MAFFLWFLSFKNNGVYFNLVFCFPNFFLRMSSAIFVVFLPSVIHFAHNKNHILLFSTCRVGCQVQMDQQGEIIGKTSVLKFYPDANRPRIQPSVVLQSLQEWFHPTSCLFRERKLLLSGILHQVKPNPGSWPRNSELQGKAGCDRTSDCVFCSSSSSQLSAEH